MKPPPSNSKLCAALLLLAFSPAVGWPQAPASPQLPAPPSQSPQPAPTTPPSAVKPEIKSRPPSESARRRAARLYLHASGLYQKQQFEQALAAYQQAAALDPANPDYRLAVEVARSHAVTALMQAAARDRLHGSNEQARAALAHALELDPQNPMAIEHMRELDGDAARLADSLDSGLKAPQLAPPIQLSPAPGVRSFHLRASQRQVIEQVFKAWDIQASLDSSLRSTNTRLDVDDVTFPESMRILAMLTESFYVPIDAHRALVARDTRNLREQYMRNAIETVYLSGLSQNEMTDMGNIARNVFGVEHAAVDQTSATLTLRAPESTLKAFNAAYSDLMEGRPEILLDVRILELAHNNAANNGAQLPQTITGFNVYTEEQSLLNQNQSLVQQIIASGLASPGDTLAILAILLASGQVSSSLFSNGFALFGGGLTLSAISPGGPGQLNLNLNSSDSRELDDYQLRLQDNEEGTLKSGSRYPIETSSFSSLGGSSLNIPGLNLPGTSGSLSSLLSSVANTVPNIPQVQYEDLGLVLKARPRVLRSGDVALNLDMKITALAGEALNNVPILANRSYSGVATIRANSAIVLAGEIDKSETRAISGMPGLSEIPGLNNITDINTQKNYATMLIIITPHVVRSPHGLGHGPMLRVDRDTTTIR